ncbi:uncharacterized protein LOC113236783 [Hyposmocoma kahamanoa]|uniref:uncharacterized protein LOC113236783 n=1 Tax=Hyposmocoma kahamanoa TaxID=1477025 RepID=UPI000E6D65D8|nr:uncharacterized protein LOC113236783 [Hyposmocoma kahamanoa]
MPLVHPYIMPSQFAAILLWLAGSVLCLRDIQLSVPEAVGVGTSTTLGCRWALDIGEALYTVKWYHGAQEFFRFVPKEMPNTRVFSQTGISVDVSRSGAHQVVLRVETRGLSGRYRCEVSADAPYFHTVFKSAYMRVVDLPPAGPTVQTAKSWYSPGDRLEANCTTPASDPPLNLTWLINGQKPKGRDIFMRGVSYTPPRKSVLTDASLEDVNRIIFSPWDAISGYEEPVTDSVIDIPGNIDALTENDGKRKNKNESSLAPATEQMANKLKTTNEEERPNKSASFSQLHMTVEPVHFHKGRINLTCVASMFSVWSASGIVLLDEERPQIASVMGSRNSNSGLRHSTSHAGAFALLNCLLYRHWLMR